MSQPAIRVEGLWKEYLIGGSLSAGMTFRESIVEGVKAPLRRLRRNAPAPGAAERFCALRDISFTVEPGEVVGIIGRNGAGKSTLLKILSRITAPTRGRVEIRGRVASLLEVGTGFHQELTGRENIRLNGAILGMSSTEIKRKFDEIVDFSGVEKFIDTPVKRYSSGMQVRLAFAVAAHLEPEILVVDEVLAVGDSEFQRKCLGKMNEIAGKQGRTVLFVSHQLGMVAKLCSRGILLWNGQVAFSGPSEVAVDKYVTSTRVTVDESGDEDKRFDHLPAAVLGIKVCTMGGEPSGQFSWDKPFVIRIRLRIRRPIGGMLLGVGVDSVAGGRVTTWFTEIAKHVVAGEELELELSVSPKILAPGSYCLAVALTESDLNIIHIRENEWPFAVADTGSDMSAFGNVRYGCVIIPASWSSTSWSSTGAIARAATAQT